MGANNSKRSTKEYRDEFRKSAVYKQMNAMSYLRNLISSNSSALVTAENKSDMETITKMATVAETQLQRDTKPFTKTDLIAILMKIRMLNGDIKTPADAKRMVDDCNQYTVGELYSIIRCGIYDADSVTQGNTQYLLGQQQAQPQIQNQAPAQNRMITTTTGNVQSQTRIIANRT